jgi:lipopolysaccharide/colanic/teichoic acid biosynthesis glycosyltransferase
MKFGLADVMYRKYFKRLIDIFLSLLILIIISPLFLLILILMTGVCNGKPFFIQPRPGKDGKIFSVLKFKTMNEKKSVNGELLPDIERITTIGKFIRKTSLDELPQLLNVLQGNLSLVGPRPLLVEYLPLYNDFQRRRHEVKPGITGWAQVNGRNAISWDEKFKLDIWYVENISFAIDMKILLLTAMKIFKTNDINSSKTVTMERFTGCSID